MDYALIKDGKVVNVIVAEQDFIDSIQSQYDHIEAIDTIWEQQQGVWIGWSWDAETGFTAPEAPVGSEVTIGTKISVGSFLDRFGAFKYPILADTNPLVQALIKDVSVRKYIDLSDPQLPTGLGMLVQAGHGIDVDAILTTPVTPEEL